MYDLVITLRVLNAAGHQVLVEWLSIHTVFERAGAGALAAGNK